jgi:hypothetical protein
LYGVEEIISSGATISWSDVVGLSRTPQLRVNYLTGGIYEQETEIQQRIQA